MDYYNQEKKYPEGSYTKNNGDRVITKTIRINEIEAKNWDSKTIHDFLLNTLENNNSLDTIILRKMIPHFIEYGLKVNFEENEIERVKQLIEEIQENA